MSDLCFLNVPTSTSIPEIILNERSLKIFQSSQVCKTGKRESKNELSSPWRHSPCPKKNMKVPIHQKSAITHHGSGKLGYEVSLFPKARTPGVALESTHKNNASTHLSC